MVFLSPTFSLLVLLGTVFSAGVLFADPTLTHQGLSTQKDKRNRSPILSVGIQRGEAQVQLLADAQIPREDAKDHPLRFDFFVNRQLVTSQIRSIELPGPVGITVDTTVTPIPFNYSVIVTQLYPNGHSYPSMVSGAIFENNLVSEVDCELNISEGSLQFSAENISTSQVDNQGFQYSFEAESADASQKVSVSGTVSAYVSAGEGTDTDGSASANGLITYTIDGDSASTKTVSLSGDVSQSNGALSSFSLSSEDSSVSLDCTSSNEAAIESAVVTE